VPLPALVGVDDELPRLLAREGGLNAKASFEARKRKRRPIGGRIFLDYGWVKRGNWFEFGLIRVGTRQFGGGCHEERSIRNDRILNRCDRHTLGLAGVEDGGDGLCGVRSCAPNKGR
jgi:hypothetical protein